MEKKKRIARVYLCPKCWKKISLTDSEREKVVDKRRRVICPKCINKIVMLRAGFIEK